MRALSADEAAALVEIASINVGELRSGPPGSPDEARWDAAYASVVARGCAITWEDERNYWWDITDLGRLALRVSRPVPT